MGNFNISINGIGAHHNKDNPTDANKMAKKFVKDLNEAGHTLSKATFTHGPEDDLQTEEDD